MVALARKIRFQVQKGPVGRAKETTTLCYLVRRE